MLLRISVRSKHFLSIYLHFCPVQMLCSVGTRGIWLLGYFQIFLVWLDSQVNGHCINTSRTPGVQQVHSYQRIIVPLNRHGIMECFGLERTLKDHLVPAPSHEQGHLLLAKIAPSLSNLALETSKDRKTTTSLNSLCHVLLHLQ